MDEPRPHPSTAELERQLLAALCSAVLDRRKRVQILERLRSHAFADPDHAVIFQALANMPTAGARHIRETLAARVTRLGFPDIDVNPILEIESPSVEKIDALLLRLER